MANSDSHVPVYFDNLQVSHIRGPILEETHYYPFGLTMAGISSKATEFGSPANKILFNGYEQQSIDFTDGSGIEWYDYKNRFYDNQLGRFFCIDKRAPNYPYYTPFQFAGNQVTVATDLDGNEPKYMIDGNGHLTKPMKALLHAAFGFSLNTLNKTAWKPSDIQFADAITIFRTVYYSKYFRLYSDSEWARLIAHEQNHRDEIGNGVVSATNWYLNYGINYIPQALKYSDQETAYRNNPFESRAYAIDERAGRLLNFSGGIVLRVLQGNYDDESKSEALNFLGLVFNLSEEVGTLNSLQTRLSNFAGSEKAKRRLEKRVERQQRKVDAAAERAQNAANETVLDTIKDANE